MYTHPDTHLACPVLSIHCPIQVTWPSKRGRDKEQYQQTTMPPGPHLFYWQWSWLSHTETRGPILNPGAAYSSGTVARSTRAVFVLVSSWKACKAQQRQKTGVYQVKPSGGIFKFNIHTGSSLVVKVSWILRSPHGEVLTNIMLKILMVTHTYIHTQLHILAICIHTHTHIYIYTYRYIVKYMHTHTHSVTS